jgi:putative membrane-bound dehydrogenase-like protein
MGTSIGTPPPGWRGIGNLIHSGTEFGRSGRFNPLLASRFLEICAVILLFGAVEGVRADAATNTTAPVSTSRPVQTLTNGLGAFRVEHGFRIELVASEPMVNAPGAMAFDENGRLFVVEMRGRDNSGASLGRVRMLENMNEDGVFQNSTIYADNLTMPSAVACYAGGIFVAAAPDLIYLKDTKGDGIADARQVVMTGFGGTNTLDPNFLPNNFNWGPDNRIHAASGGVGGEIAVQNSNGPRVSLLRRDFSFDPRTLEIFPEAGPAESGLCFDSFGREFVTDYVRPLLMPAYDVRYTTRNPYYPKPSSLTMVANPNETIFPYLAPALPGTRGRPSANVLTNHWMMHAQGCVVYRGRAFPTNYLDNVFIAEPDAHLVHRVLLTTVGLSVTARKPPEELNTEFLISSDPSFRPAQIINGPDGALYLADMQEGNERGRIYRILPERFKRSKPPQLGKVKTYDLVSTLAQGDGWHRDTAERLLYERKDPAAAGLLRGTLRRSRLVQARVLALQALAGAAALTEDDVIKGLQDLDELVRRQAVVSSESLFHSGEAPVALSSQLNGMVADPSLLVRCQLTFTLGQLQRPDLAQTLAQIVARDLYQPAVRDAVLSSAGPFAGRLFALLAANSQFQTDPVGFEFLGQLASIVGLSGRQDAVSDCAGFLAKGTLAPAPTYQLLFDLADGLYRTRSSLALIDNRGMLQPLYSGAFSLATDISQPELARAAATRLLGVSTLGVGSIGDWLMVVCSPPTGPVLQTAAAEALSRYGDPQVVDAVMQLWPALAPIAKNRALSSLLSRSAQADKVLDAFRSGTLGLGDFSSEQKNLLRTYPVPAVRLRAVQLLGPVSVGRPEVMTRYKPALGFTGAPERGREVFRQRCAGCHFSSLTTLAPGLGPELLHARTYSKDKLLSKILQPNAEVRRDYLTQLVESKEGQSMVGIVTEENNQTMTFQQADGTRIVWPQLNIRGVEPLSWSLMPDGLEAGLSPQDMADLMQFITQGKR